MKNCSIVACVAGLSVAFGVSAAAFAQPDGKPAGASAVAAPSASAPSEFDLSWQGLFPQAILWRSLGNYEGMLAQLNRIETTLPTLADKAKAAATTLRDRLGPGIEKIKTELKRRGEEAFNTAWTALEENIKSEIEKVDLKEAEVVAAFDAKRWDASTLQANLLAPVLIFTPRYLEKPEAVWEDGYTARVCQPIKGVNGKRLCTTLPRTWAPDKKRTPAGALWAISSNLSRGAGTIVMKAIVLKEGEGKELTAEAIKKEYEKSPPVAPGKQVSLEIVQVGARRAVVQACEVRLNESDEAYDQYFQTFSWVDGDVRVDLICLVGHGRKSSDPEIPSARLKAVYDLHLPLIRKMIESTKLEDEKVEKRE